MRDSRGRPAGLPSHVQPCVSSHAQPWLRPQTYQKQVLGGKPIKNRFWDAGTYQKQVLGRRQNLFLIGSTAPEPVFNRFSSQNLFLIGSWLVWGLSRAGIVLFQTFKYLDLQNPDIQLHIEIPRYLDLQTPSDLDTKISRYSDTQRSRPPDIQKFRSPNI